MATTLKTPRRLFPAFGAPQTPGLPLVNAGKPITVLSEKIDGSGVKWVEVRVELSGKTGWVKDPEIDDQFEVVLEEITDKTAYAQSCLDAARLIGTRAHFLLAWAQLASGLTNKRHQIGSQQLIGPYRLTEAEWENSRIIAKEAFEAIIDKNDFTKPDFHPYAAAVIASDIHEALAATKGGDDPTALELTLGCLLGDKAAALVLKAENGGKQLKDIVRESFAGSDAEAQASNLLARHAEIIADGKVADAVSGLSDKLAQALAATTDIIKSLPDDEFPLAAEQKVGESTDPDEMVLLQYSSGTMVRGHVVAQLQKALQIANPDGLLGPNTRDALNAWLVKNGQPANGRITAKQWKQLTGAAPPSIYDLCAQLTAAFEGHGFGEKIAGDSDGGLITCGYLGFTWAFGHIQKILKRIDDKDKAVLVAAFGTDKAGTLRGVLAKSEAEQIAFAKSINIAGNKIRPEWEAGFKALGKNDAARAVQLDYGRDEFWDAAEQSRAKLGLSERLSSALCFDIHVQNGPIKTADVLQQLAAAKIATEIDKRVFLGEIIVKKAKDQFKGDVKARKVDCLARGKGRVHGEDYDLGYWGLDPRAKEIEDHLSGDEDNLATKLEAGEVKIEKDDSFADFFFKNVSQFVTGFAAVEFLVKGGSNSAKNPNGPPPPSLWPNMVNLARVLQHFKSNFAGGNPVIITSCYRSPSYNKAIGGAKKSMHMQFKAADIVVKGKGNPKVWGEQLRLAQKACKCPGGIGIYRGFTHVDVRGSFVNWGG